MYLIILYFIKIQKNVFIYNIIINYFLIFYKIIFKIILFLLNYLIFKKITNFVDVLSFIGIYLMYN